MKTALAFVALMATMGNAVAEPILAKPPYPPGFVRPKVLDYRAMPISTHAYDGLSMCLVFDVELDGSTSNVNFLRSSGNSDADAMVVAWLSKRQYGPATLNGKPVVSRLLFRQYFGENAKPGECSWDMYKLVS